MLTKEAILAAGRVTHEAVTVPGLAEPLYVWQMTGLENDKLDDESYVDNGKGGVEFNHANYRARLFIACVRDADGVPKFGPGDLAAVSAMSAAVLNRVLEVARRINGMTKADVETAGKN